MAGKAEKRKKRPVVTPSPKIPAPKRIPGGRPLQPRYEKPGKPERTVGEAASKIEVPPPKPGKTLDRSLSGHWVELGEPAQKKDEKPKPKVNVKMNLLAGLVAGLIAAGVIAGVFWSQGFFGGGGGGGGGGIGGYDGTYNCTVTTVAPNQPTTSIYGTFTVVNGYVSSGTFTGTVDANGYFVGTTIVSPGSPQMAMTGQFSLTGNFTIYGSSGNVNQTIVAYKV